MRRNDDRKAREPAKREPAKRQPARGPALPTYAAIDLGTNNCRLLAARPAGSGMQVVDSFSRIVRLGEKVSLNGALDEKAIERTLSALRICAGKIRRLSPRRVRAVATEACRRAVNCPEFLDRVEADTGLRFEPIPPEEEARLTVTGCVPLFDADRPFVLLFDIGGGSTEITWIEQDPGSAPQILGTRSLPIGVMTIAERYGTCTLNADARDELAARVGDELVSLDTEHGISDRVAAREVRLLGTSGTVTTLGGIHQKLPRYDRLRVDGTDITFAAIEALIERIGTMDVEARARIPCVGRQRADLMAAGCALLQAIIRQWPVGSLRVADRGIREGILLELMATDGTLTGPALIPGLIPAESPA